MPRLTAIQKQALDEVMKEAFFNATVTVLAKHGVEGMTMDRVAAAASVAKGSLYHYFRSKKDLLQFVYAKIVDPIFHNLVETVASEQSATEKLASHLRHLLEHLMKHARVFRLLFDDDTAHGLLQSTERTTQEEGSQHLAKIFRQGIAEGDFHPGDPLLFARMFLGLCRGVFDSQPELEKHDQRERALQLIMGTFLNGIAIERREVG